MTVLTQQLIQLIYLIFFQNNHVQKSLNIFKNEVCSQRTSILCEVLYCNLKLYLLNKRGKGKYVLKYLISQVHFKIWLNFSNNRKSGMYVTPPVIKGSTY